MSFATVAGLRDLLDRGMVMRVRGQEVREIRNRTTVLQRPHERCLLLRHRANDVFASLAETFWVLAGRSDVGWLQHYLPRAPDFSDDGFSWRAAYGPRLRNWNGLDQLDRVRELLIEERLTRRAVMSLYDPDRDFVASKDIPCCNWLHWLVRNDRLHLNIGIRSNDVIWGFSGINAFEWSILQEMMAYWIDASIGDATYLASSFHIYDRHYERARKIVDDFDEVTLYDYGIANPVFRTPWDEFDEALRHWFELEELVRRSADAARARTSTLADPLLGGALDLLRVYNGSRQGWAEARLRQELAALPETDFTVAAYEFFGRRYPKLINDIPQPTVATFFRTYGGAHSLSTRTPREDTLRLVIKSLHRKKDATYGDAWKRRGEVTSIIANIARKVDRLVRCLSLPTHLDEESVLDTAIDLFVYVTKYRLFLLEITQGSAAPVLPVDAPRPFSDHVSNFETLVDQAFVNGSDAVAFAVLVGEILVIFEDLHAAAASDLPVDERLASVNRLWISSGRLLNTLAFHNWKAIESLCRSHRVMRA